MYPCFMALRGRLREKAAPFLDRGHLCSIYSVHSGAVTLQFYFVKT